MTALLTVRDVAKGFEDGGGAQQVFSEFSLALEAGQTLAVTGASGSGKSTLLNLIAGLEQVDAGSLTLCAPSLGPEPFRYGQLDVSATAVLRRRALGYVFQFFNLVPTLTVAENIELSLKLADRQPAFAEACARLEAMGLGDTLQRFPDTLSGGEQQRVAIARALAASPPLVLADEPTGNLDGANASAVAGLLFDAVRATGAAMVIATHDPTVAAQADRHLELG